MPTRTISRLGPSEQRVRDLVNELNHNATHHTRRWYQICAAMDTIGDTAAVLDSTIWRSQSRSFAYRYLRLYGLLQAIHAQQDSIQFLWRYVGGRTRWSASTPAWRQLRILRNDLVAHSANNAVTVSRVSLLGASPKVLRWSTDTSPPEFTTIHFDRLVDGYIAEAAQELDALALELTQLCRTLAGS